MRLPVFVQGCSLAALAACAGPSDGAGTKPMAMTESAPSADTQQPDGDSAESKVVNASMPGGESGAEDPMKQAQQPKPRMRSEVRAVLLDPEFQRRLALSYLAETDTEPELAPEERELLQGVLELVTAEDIPGAEAMLREGLTQTSSAALDFYLGNLRYQQDDYLGAAAAYEVACDKHPRFRRAWGNLAQIYYAEGRFPDAIRTLTQVIALGGGDSMTYALLGVAHSKGEDYLAAESAFRMAVMLEPQKLDYRMALAETLFRQERYASASVLFGHLIEKYPDRAELWNFQGEAYAMLDRPLEAAQNFEVVDQLGKSNSVLLNNLGDIYSSQSLYELAVDAYLRALKKDDKAKVDRAMQAARYLSANGAHEEMAKLLDGIDEIRGATMAPDNKSKLLKLRAFLASSQGADEEQLRQLREVIKMDPRDGEALILIGRNVGRTGSPEEAVAYFEMAANIEGFEAEAALRHGELLVQQGQFAEGLRLLKRSQDLRPQEHVRKFIEDVERVSKSSS